MRRSWTPQEAGDVRERLILFDGVCVLCSSWVRFLLARDRAERFRFVPIQSAYGARLAAAWRMEPEAPETNAVVLGGRVHFKSDATIRALAELPGWRWALGLLAIPRGLRDWLYDGIARRRYRLFGRTEACLLPPPELRRRFLHDPPADDARRNRAPH